MRSVFVGNGEEWEWIFFGVNGMYIYLSGLILILQLGTTYWVEFKWVCRKFRVSTRSLPGERIAVPPSAQVTIIVFKVFGMSAT